MLLNPTAMDIGDEDDEEIYITTPTEVPQTQPATIPAPSTIPTPTRVPAGV